MVTRTLLMILGIATIVYVVDTESTAISNHEDEAMKSVDEWSFPIAGRRLLGRRGRSESSRSSNRDRGFSGRRGRSDSSDRGRQSRHKGHHNGRHSHHSGHKQKHHHSNSKKYGYKKDHHRDNKHHDRKHDKSKKHHIKYSDSSDDESAKRQYSRDRRYQPIEKRLGPAYDCNYFEQDGSTFATLQALAAVFLRGMNMISSDNRRTRKEGLRLYENKLYPFMLDSFVWENEDAGEVVESKRELKDRAEELGESIPNSFGLESFAYFDCEDDDEVKVTMYFNAYERWDDTDESPTSSPTSDPTSQPSFEPTEQPTSNPTDDDNDRNDDDDDDNDVVERYWNVQICFEWDEDDRKFMMERFSYDDPLSDSE